MKKMTSTAILIVAVMMAYAQKIPVEVLVGHKAVNTQLILNKKFAENSKFGFFSILNYNMPFDKEIPIFRYHMIQTNIYGQITKNIRVFGGGFTNPLDYGGMAGLQAVFPSKNSFLLIHNGHYLVKKYASQLMILFEHHAKLNEQSKIYMRMQVMGESNFKEFKRGFQMLRLGFEKNNFQYGVAATFDQFGSKPIAYENYGFFIRTEL
jgi:hypothetical protein